MLVIGVLIPVLDSMASAAAALATVLATVSGDAAAELGALLATSDPLVLSQLAPIYASRGAIVGDSHTIASVLQGAYIQRALDKHYGASGGLNGFLTANDARVHDNLRLCGMQIDSRNVFAPQVVGPVASFEVVGAGPDTFAAGLDVDTSKYGNTAFQVVVDAMGALDLVLRIAIVTFDGVTLHSDVTVPAHAAPGAVVAMPGKGVHIADITRISGGTNGDRVHLRSVVERLI